MPALRLLLGYFHTSICAHSNGSHHLLGKTGLWLGLVYPAAAPSEKWSVDCVRIGMRIPIRNSLEDMRIDYDKASARAQGRKWGPVPLITGCLKLHTHFL